MIPEAAVYLDLGWSIFPVNGKTPATAHGVKDATADEAQAERWFTNGKVGVALATGTPSGIWALDIDGKEGERKIERLQGEHGPLPTTLTSRTGNGFHLLFALPEGVDVRNSAGKIAPGIDVRGTGGYVVLPPSPHPSGGSYKWVKGRSLSDLKPVEAPFWLLKLAVAESNRTGSAEPLPEKIEQGRRNDRLASLAGSMRRRGATGASIAAALHEENRSRCHPPLRDAEVEKIAASISSYPSAKAEHGLTDTGNAARLVDLHGEQLHYIPQWGKWITWAGEAGRWELDHRDVLVRELAKDVGAALQRQATAERDDEKAKKIFAFARRSLNAHGINGMVDLARGIPSIPLDHEALDADGWLLGVEGGVVDLRTGTFRPPDQNGLITMQAPVRWDEAASAPRWEQALQEWFPDPEVRAYVHRVAGAALVGLQRDHVLVIHYGLGANGKGTFTGTLQHVLGPYAVEIHLSLLVQSRYQEHDTVKADLFRSRLAVAVETERRVQLAEASVKNLTGGDRIRARRMREDPWSFDPTHTLWLQTNHLPAIAGRDTGIWRRIRVVKWETTFKEKTADPELREKLAGEGPGILRWLVEGCLAWQRDGLAEPETVVRDTLAYRDQEDVLSRFASDNGLTFDPKLQIRAGVLQELLAEWASDEGVDSPRSEVGEWLREHGCTQKRGRWKDQEGHQHQARFWVGVGIAAPKNDNAKKPAT